MLNVSLWLNSTFLKFMKMLQAGIIRYVFEIKFSLPFLQNSEMSVHICESFMFDIVSETSTLLYEHSKFPRNLTSSFEFNFVLPYISRYSPMSS